MVHRVGVVLCLEREGATVGKRLAVLANVSPAEEVPAIKLERGFGRKNRERDARGGGFQPGSIDQLRTVGASIDDPSVIVTLGERELFVPSRKASADAGRRMAPIQWLISGCPLFTELCR